MNDWEKVILLERENETLRATLAERDRESEELRVDRQSAEQTYCDRLEHLRAQLAETQAKLKEVEKRVEQLTEINNGLHGVFTHNLALQAHVGELREPLLLCKDALEYGGIGDDRPHNRLIALIESERSKFSGDNWDYWNYLSEKLQACGQPLANALSSQPDLTLIEEVREVLTRCIETFDWLRQSKEMDVAPNSLDQLLTRLNPRK